MSEATMPTTGRGTILDEEPLAAAADDPVAAGSDADVAAEETTGAEEAGEEPSLADLDARWQESADRSAWQPPTARRRRRRVRAAAILVLAALLAVIGYGAWRLHSDDQLAAARASALAAGKADAQLISTYTYQTFPAYSKKIVATSTKQFSDNFTKDAGSLGTILAQYKAGSKGTVIAAGLEPGATTSKATVDVFLNETVTNSKNSSPQSERARMVVTLVRRGGHWLIANAIVE